MKFRKRNIKSRSDEDLVAEYQKDGSLEVLGVLYERYMPLVYGVCLKYLKNRANSQDAVTQIFELLIEQVSKHEIKTFKSWLYGVSRNYCLMQLRSQQTQKSKMIVLSDTSFMENNMEAHHTNEESLVLDQKTKALNACLATLKDLQRKCVEAFFFEEKCYQEIADEVQIDEKQVKSSLQNGKRNLKICLQKTAKVNYA